MPSMILQLPVSFAKTMYDSFTFQNMSDLKAVTLSNLRSETSKDVMPYTLLAQIQTRKWSRNTDLELYSCIKDEFSIFK